MEADRFSKINFKSVINDIEDLVGQELTNRNIVKGVENIRFLSEFLIYSHKKGDTYFELFIERNVLETFSSILDKQDVELNKQLIQTMSILIQNITEENENYYLF